MNWLPVSLLLILSLVAAEKKDCEVCRGLVDKFNEHLEKTARQNYGGGNTAWEEKSLGSYAKSETRLVEVLEKTCSSSDYKCGTLLENKEEFLEDWFFKKQESHPSLFSYLCIKDQAVCCKKNRWGKDCAECPGGVDKPCSGFGTCRGEGDRQGEGTCNCDKGYNGTTCEGCKKMYIRVDDRCEECSKLCKGQCTGLGPQGCVECIKGYEKKEDEGCTDINECERDGCGDPLEDCMNSAGSFECVCKKDYHRVGGKCVLEDLYADENEDSAEDSETSAEGETSVEEDTPVEDESSAEVETSAAVEPPVEGDVKDNGVDSDKKDEL